MKYYPNLGVGDRVIAYDGSQYLDDKRTPIASLMKPATVVRRYSKQTSDGRICSDLVDLQFDHHRGRISSGHFTNWVKPIG